MTNTARTAAVPEVVGRSMPQARATRESNRSQGCPGAHHQPPFSSASEQLGPVAVEAGHALLHAVPTLNAAPVHADPALVPGEAERHLALAHQAPA